MRYRRSRAPLTNRPRARLHTTGRSGYNTPLQEADLQLRQFLDKERDKICLDIAASQIQLCSEFAVGLLDEETRFEDDWLRGDNMRIKIDDDVAKVWLDEARGLICARFAFKRECVDQIKNDVPKGKKNWNPDLKVWEFSVEAIDIVLDILGRYFTRVIDLTKETPQSHPSTNHADQLLTLIDQEDAKKIYRMLAVKYHPDKQGGSSEVMAKINQVFTKFGKSVN